MTDTSAPRKASSSFRALGDKPDRAMASQRAAGAAGWFCPAHLRYGRRLAAIETPTRVLLGALIWLLSAASVAHAVEYRVKEIKCPALHWTAGVSLNNNGVVVGYGETASPVKTRGFYYRNGHCAIVGLLGPVGSSGLVRVNDAGEAVGSASDTDPNGSVAISFKNGQMTRLVSFPSMTDTINKNGDITGRYDGARSFALVKGAIRYFDDFYYLFINDGGVMAGPLKSADICQLIIGNQRINLAKNFAVVAINNRGQVIGEVPAPNHMARAFLYEQGHMTNLGVYPGAPAEVLISARAINDNGDVVGSAQ